MENVLTSDIQPLLSEEFWYFCLKKLPCLSIEFLMTLIALLLVSLVVLELRTRLLLSLAGGGCRCQQQQQLPLAAPGSVLEWVKH